MQMKYQNPNLHTKTTCITKKRNNIFMAPTDAHEIIKTIDTLKRKKTALDMIIYHHHF